MGPQSPDDKGIKDGRDQVSNESGFHRRRKSEFFLEAPGIFSRSEKKKATLPQ